MSHGGISFLYDQMVKWKFSKYGIVPIHRHTNEKGRRKDVYKGNI